MTSGAFYPLNPKPSPRSLKDYRGIEATELHSHSHVRLQVQDERVNERYDDVKPEVSGTQIGFRVP